MTISFPMPPRSPATQRWLLLPWGVLPGSAWVRLEDDQLVARFGFFSLNTPIANIVRWEISGPFRWFTALALQTRSASRFKCGWHIGL